jgi:hypothetical protein
MKKPDPLRGAGRVEGGFLLLPYGAVTTVRTTVGTPLAEEA